jgi:hypothetical protein
LKYCRWRRSGGRTSWQSGFWHKVARWIVTVEEEQLVEDLGNGFVAEHERLHGIDLDFPSHAGSCGVRAWRREADGELEVVTAVICPTSHGNCEDLLCPS